MTMYVAYCCEHLRDGEEECASIFATREDALAWINRMANGFGGCNSEFRLFELGKEIPLSKGTIDEPQPAKTETRFNIRQGTA